MYNIVTLVLDRFQIWANAFIKGTEFVHVLFGGEIWVLRGNLQLKPQLVQRKKTRTFSLWGNTPNHYTTT